MCVAEKQGNIVHAGASVAGNFLLEEQARLRSSGISVKISDTGVYGKIPALCPQRSSLGYIAIVYWIYYNYDYNYKAGCLLAATWNYISIRLVSILVLGY